MAVNPNQCRKCKLETPIIEMTYYKGISRRLCRDCYNITQRDRYNRNGLSKGSYNFRHSLTTHNGRCLASLPAPKAYPLTYLNTGDVVGYIVLKRDSYLVKAWQALDLLAIDQYSTALWLSNQGLSIGLEAITLTDPEGAPIDLEQVGKGLELGKAVDRLYMINLNLQNYAVKKVKAEIDALKRPKRGRPSAFSKPPLKPKA